jgi:hypothetical protein
LAKEMAEQLSRLPAATEQRKTQSWVAAERENASNSQHGRHDTSLERSPSFRLQRPRWAGRRIDSTRSLVHKRDDHNLKSVSGHSRGSTSRSRSNSPLINETSTVQSSHPGQMDHSTNLSGRSGQSSGRSRSFSPSETETTQRKAGKRPASFRNRKGQSAIGEHKDMVDTGNHGSNHHHIAQISKGGSRDHEVTLHVKEHFVDKQGRAVDIEVKGTLKEGKKHHKERSALQRRRLERRQQLQQQGGDGRRVTTSLREARTYSRRDQTPRLRSHSPTRNSEMVSEQKDDSKPMQAESRNQLSPKDLSPSQSDTKKKNATKKDHSPLMIKSETQAGSNQPLMSSLVEPIRTTHLFECSINGNSQVIDLCDWNSSSSQSMDSHSIHSTSTSKESTASPRRRTIVMYHDDVEFNTTADNNATKPLKEISVPTREGQCCKVEECSIGLVHVIRHMDVLHDLEGLAEMKALEQKERTRIRRLQAKEHVMQLIDNKMTMEDFQKRYHLAKEDMKKLTRHVRLCLKTKEEIQWDLVFQILLSSLDAMVSQPN